MGGKIETSKSVNKARIPIIGKGNCIDPIMVVEEWEEGGGDVGVSVCM